MVSVLAQHAVSADLSWTRAVQTIQTARSKEAEGRLVLLFSRQSGWRYAESVGKIFASGTL